MNTLVLCAFCVVLTSTCLISAREYEVRANYRKLALANNELAFNLYRRLTSGSSDNVFFSPLSISTAFGMLFYGARGYTAQELREALGYERAHLGSDFVHTAFNHYLREVLNRTDYSDGYVFNSANAVLVDKRLELHDEYRRDVQEFYRATVRDVDFRRGAPRIVEEINEYVREKTNGKIERFLDELNPFSSLILLNAVYFKGTFKTEFERKETRYETFYNHGLESEGRRVPFMHVRSQFPYVHFDDFQALELPYFGGNISMLIFLPNDRNGLRYLEENLTHEKLSEIQRQLYRNNVDVALPKFKLQFEKELSPEFRDLGVNKIFSTGADFLGISHSRNAFVSQVFHKAIIEVNEEGGEDAAVTGVVAEKYSLSHEYSRFRVDHPFLFAILEKGSNAILFLGRVNNF